jgi:hypothetical protein
MAGPDPFHKSGDEGETPVGEIEFPDEGDVVETHSDGTTAEDHPEDVAPDEVKGSGPTAEDENDG